MPKTSLMIQRISRRVPALALVAVASILATTPCSAIAQDTLAKDTTPRARTLDKMVVTATRSANSVRELPQKIEVIGRRDIEQTPVKDLTDILKRFSTLDVVQYPTLLSGVGIRGFRPETGGLNRRSQVLIDGRPTGTGNLSMFMLDNVEQIEVVKGATSALYGSGGMGGTVNVITRKSRGPLKASASAAYGSFRMTDFSAYAGGSLPAGFDFDLSGNHYRLGDDYDLGNGSILRGAFGSRSAQRFTGPTGLTPVIDSGAGTMKSGSKYSLQNGAGRLGYAFNTNSRIDVSGELFKSNGARTPGDDPMWNGLKDVSRNAFDVMFSGAYGRHVPRVRVFSTYEDNDTYNDTTGANNFINFASQTRSMGMQAQDVMQFGNHTVTTGIDFIRDKATSNRRSDPVTPIAPYSANSRNTSIGLFAQSHWRALDNRLTGTIGGRLDRITLDLLETPLLITTIEGKQHFTTFNPSAGIQYTTTEDIRFHSSIGRAFIVPEAGNMAGYSYLPTTQILTAGNPDLKPESSVTFDVGAGYSPLESGFEVDLTYFNTRVSNRITTATATFATGDEPEMSNGDPVSSARLYVNADNAVMHGFEATLGYDFGKLLGGRYVLRAYSTATRLFSASEYVRSATVDAAQFANAQDFDATDVRDAIVFGPRSKRRVRNVSPLTVNAGLEYSSLGRWSGRVSGRYVGNRLDQDFSVFPSVDILYAPFATIDAVVGYQVLRNYRLEALVNNITDENYYEKRGYNLPGRQLQLRMTVNR